MKLEFKSEDFLSKGWEVSPNVQNFVEHMVVVANARLQEMIKEAPVVYGREWKKMGMSWGHENFCQDTHTARLVDIKEMGK